MEGISREPLTVQVRLLPEPCLWTWEIRDEREHQVIESSWAAEWTAFESADEAFRAGDRWLRRFVGQ